MRFNISIDRHDPDMAGLYAHLAKYPGGKGKRIRSEIIRAVLRVGSIAYMRSLNGSEVTAELKAVSHVDGPDETAPQDASPTPARQPPTAPADVGLNDYFSQITNPNVFDNHKDA